MTKEQQKAEELYEFFSEVDTNKNDSGCPGFRMAHVSAKQCAIKVCDEVIDSMPLLPSPIEKSIFKSPIEAKKFWQSVKQHLEQM